MKLLRRRAALLTVTVAVAATAISTSVLADPGGRGDNPWPYAQVQPVVLAAVGDIACEPETDENASSDAFYKCDGGNLAGMAAQYATADQVESMQPNLVAVLGDEQYQTGRLSDFENSFDKSYGAFKFLQRPTPGNHEYYGYAKTKSGHVINEPAQNGVGYFDYYNGQTADGQTRPAGQAGDSDQGWYSYDLGGWHIISLNAECNSAPFGNSCDPHSGLLGQETSWLAADLAANHSSCTLAYWHQATFSAINAPSAEGAAADAWWDLLYQAGADLVLNGHEHVYARFQPQAPDGTVDAKKGLTQFIIGTGGEDFDTLARNADGSFRNPNVVTGEDSAFGALKLQLTGDGYSWNFQPVLAGPGKPASSLDYRDSGSASCHGPAPQG
jgi:hypothetical protein